MAKNLGKMPKAIAAATIVGGLLVLGFVTGNDGDDSASSGAPTPPRTVYATPTAAPPSAPPPSTDGTIVHTAGDGASAALEKLATVAIKGRAPKTGYARSQFGDSWTDDVMVDGGRNGCDTRNDILRRDLTAVEIKPDSLGCAVLTGTLHDPYTGTTIAFQRGPDTSPHVQIDHVVALSDAWQKGAQQWDEVKRRNFANDPINLQATSGPINQQKGDGDAATWLPPNKTYRCTYVSRIVDVKAAYGLWVTQAEHDAMTRILTRCDAPDAAPAPAPVAPATAETGASVYYPSCRAAAAVGAGPVYAGEPGYRVGLDGDGDGIACE